VEDHDCFGVLWREEVRREEEEDKRICGLYTTYSKKDNEKTDKLSNAESRRKHTNRYKEYGGEVHGQGREGVRSEACGRLVVSVFDVCRCMIWMGACLPRDCGWMHEADEREEKRKVYI